jgi:hypothetical protein
MRKRYILKNKRRFCAVILSFSFIIAIIFFASSAYGYEGEKYDIINIERGDTLWGIAGRYCKNGDIRKYIYEIKKANSLTESTIFEGDELKIPLSLF